MNLNNIKRNQLDYLLTDILPMSYQIDLLTHIFMNI